MSPFLCKSEKHNFRLCRSRKEHYGCDMIQEHTGPCHNVDCYYSFTRKNRTRLFGRNPLNFFVAKYCQYGLHEEMPIDVIKIIFEYLFK
jgi:hypothetical protein